MASIKSQELRVVVTQRKAPVKKGRRELVVVKYILESHKITVSVPYNWDMTNEKNLATIKNDVDRYVRWKKVPLVKEGFSVLAYTCTKEEVEAMVRKYMGIMSVPDDAIESIVWQKRLSRTAAMVTGKIPSKMTINESLLRAPLQYVDLTIAHEVCHIHMMLSYGIKTYAVLGYHGDVFWATLSRFMGFNVRRLDAEMEKWFYDAIKK